MSVSSLTNRMSYTGNGTTDTFSYTFRIFDEDHLRVIVRDTSNVETVLTKTTHYTVSGVGSLTGGSVALVNGAFDWIDGDGDLKTGYILVIRRVLPLKQETEFRNQGSFFPEDHEDSFDKQVMINQAQQDDIDRTVKLPQTIDPADFNASLPAGIVDVANAGASLIVNATGDGFDIGPTVVSIASHEADTTNVHGIPDTSLLVKTTEVQTLTNKTIDGDDNTIQDLAVSSIKTVLADADKVLLRDASGVMVSSKILNINIDPSAAIERSKVASGAANHVLINDVSGNLSSEAALAISRGGTNNGSLAVTAGGALYTDGSKIVNVGAGVTGQYLKSNGSSAPEWSNVTAGSSFSVTSRTSTYSASINDYIIASSASFTITLPTAVGFAGQSIIVYHNGTSGTQVYTIARTSSQTINGINANYPLYHNGQSVEFMSDGSNWITKNENRVCSVIGYKNGGSVNTTTDVDWTESEDFAAIMSSGVVTIPNHFSGLWLVSTNMGTTTGTPAPRIMKNAVEYQAGPSAGGQSGSVTRTVRLAVGDTISVRPSSNLTLSSSDTATTFSMYRIGV